MDDVTKSMLMLFLTHSDLTALLIIKKKDTFQSLYLLDTQAFVDCLRPLHQVNCPDDMGE